MSAAEPSVRQAKGLVVVAVATASCHTVMSAGYAWARDRSAVVGDTLFAGSFELTPRSPGC